jgi:hypothetical protein
MDNGRRRSTAGCATSACGAIPRQPWRSFLVRHPRRPTGIGEPRRDRKAYPIPPSWSRRARTRTATASPRSLTPIFSSFRTPAGNGRSRFAKLHYFGPWADPNAALRRFRKEEPDLKAGLTPKREEEQADLLTVKKTILLFLEARKLHVESGEMEARTWREYSSYGDRLVRVLGENTPVETLVPRAIGVVDRVGHRDLQVRLGAALDAYDGVKTEKIGNPEPLDLRRPNLVVGTECNLRSSFPPNCPIPRAAARVKLATLSAARLRAVEYP